MYSLLIFSLGKVITVKRQRFREGVADKLPVEPQHSPNLPLPKKSEPQQPTISEKKLKSRRKLQKFQLDFKMNLQHEGMMRLGCVSGVDLAADSLPGSSIASDESAVPTASIASINVFTAAVEALSAAAGAAGVVASRGDTGGLGIGILPTVFEVCDPMEADGEEGQQGRLSNSDCVQAERLLNNENGVVEKLPGGVDVESDAVSQEESQGGRDGLEQSLEAAAASLTKPCAEAGCAMAMGLEMAIQQTSDFFASFGFQVGSQMAAMALMSEGYDTAGAAAAESSVGEAAAVAEATSGGEKMVQNVEQQQERQQEPALCLFVSDSCLQGSFEQRQGKLIEVADTIGTQAYPYDGVMSTDKEEE